MYIFIKYVIIFYKNQARSEVSFFYKERGLLFSETGRGKVPFSSAFLFISVQQCLLLCSACRAYAICKLMTILCLHCLFVVPCLLYSMSALSVFVHYLPSILCLDVSSLCFVSCCALFNSYALLAIYVLIQSAYFCVNICG